ncbi:MAG: hypothetical protein U9O54_06970 [Chloroflexota bacterium]|nr:hypothetical protein [Chloroflexota bacterium]
MTKRKTVRFYPFDNDKHRAILKWLETQSGTDNQNMIHLMTQGLKVENGAMAQGRETPVSSLDIQTLLPEMRKIINSAIQNALKNANVELSQNEQEILADEETQAFIRGMADNFS